MTPPRQRFAASPATVVIGYDTGNEYWLGSHVEWSRGPTDTVPVSVLLYGLGDSHWFPLESLDEIAPSLWQGTTVAEGGSGPTVTIRPAVEDDVTAAVTTAGFPRVSMPLAVISSIFDSDGEFAMPTLWAMSDDEGFVVTMMLNTDAGLFVRYSNAWFRLNDPDAVDGLTATEVDDASVDMFDQFDQAGQMVALTAMRQKGGEPLATPVAGASDTPEAEPAVVESTEESVKEVPILSSAADLESAIAAATGDESLQWYVERRAAALGLTAEFPWQ